MSNDNVAAVRNAYAVAERKDVEGWIKLFTPDGVFTDNSVGVTYRSRSLADPVRNYGTAFSDMTPDRFIVRPVRTGETAGGQTPILDGLKPGDEVVVRGSFVLKSHLLKSTMESE